MTGAVLYRMHARVAWPAGRSCHTRNNWNGLAITADALMLSLKPSEITFHAWKHISRLWSWPDDLHIQTSDHSEDVPTYQK